MAINLLITLLNPAKRPFVTSRGTSISERSYFQMEERSLGRGIHNSYIHKLGICENKDQVFVSFPGKGFILTFGQGVYITTMIFTCILISFVTTLEISCGDNCSRCRIQCDKLVKFYIVLLSFINLIKSKSFYRL